MNGPFPPFKSYVEAILAQGEGGKLEDTQAQCKCVVDGPRYDGEGGQFHFDTARPGLRVGLLVFGFIAKLDFRKGSVDSR